VLIAEQQVKRRRLPPSLVPGWAPRSLSRCRASSARCRLVSTPHSPFGVPGRLLRLSSGGSSSRDDRSVKCPSHLGNRSVTSCSNVRCQPGRESRHCLAQAPLPLSQIVRSACASQYLCSHAHCGRCVGLLRRTELSLVTLAGPASSNTRRVACVDSAHALCLSTSCTTRSIN
jgi:hypothetical protein